MAPLESVARKPVDDTAPTYRSAPHNIEAEQALLGAILVNNEALYRVSDFLEPEHFFEPIHQKIYELARDLIRAGKIATPVTLKTFLDANVDIGGMTLGAIPRPARRRSHHHHQRRGLRPHHLRPADPPLADPGRRGHGQRRLRRAGRLLAAQPDRGRRAQALRTGRKRPLRRRLPAFRAVADHRDRHGGARLPARRQALRPRHRPRRSRPHDGRPAAVRPDHPRRPSRHGQNARSPPTSATTSPRPGAAKCGPTATP